MREVWISPNGLALKALGAHGLYEVSECPSEVMQESIRKNSQASRDCQQQSLTHANLSFFFFFFLEGGGGGGCLKFASRRDGWELFGLESKVYGLRFRVQGL